MKAFSQAWKPTIKDSDSELQKAERVSTHEYMTSICHCKMPGLCAFFQRSVQRKINLPVAL